MLENPMVRTEAAELDAVARTQRQARCFAMHVDEFLDALAIGSHMRISVGTIERSLGDVVSDMLLDDQVAIADLLAVLKEKRDVGLWLARTYADRELSRYVDEGSL